MIKKTNQLINNSSFFIFHNLIKGEHDGYFFHCLIPLNVMLANVYLVIWFGFITLTVALAFSILYRLVIFCLYEKRGWFVTHDCYNLSMKKLNMACATNFGAFFFLEKLAPMMEQEVFMSIVEGLSLNAINNQYK